MPKELKPGWVYVNNDNPLGLEYAIHKETGWVYFEDGVKYSPEEIKILIETGGPPVSKGLHVVKKMFQGEIVRYEGKGTDDKGKSDKNGGGNNTGNNTDTGKEVPEITKNSPAIRQGELEIY
jgi:hypothetical protein